MKQKKEDDHTANHQVETKPTGPTEKTLSHINDKGLPQMVDVSEKPITKRVATAQALIILGQEIMDKLEQNDFSLAKGPVLQTAIIAGTMAVKKTAELIPLCHTLPISGCDIEIQKKDKCSLWIRCRVKTNANTGVEMEALHGAMAAALTIYDMCKAMSHDIRIDQILLLNKSGGKRNYNIE